MDNKIKIEKGTKISELLKEKIENSEYPVVGAKFKNEYKSLDYEIKENGQLELIDINSKQGMKIYRRTLTFIMGKAFHSILVLTPRRIAFILDIIFQLWQWLGCNVMGINP